MSVVEHYSENYMLPRRKIQTIQSLFDAKYMNMSHPELINACMNIKLNASRENNYRWRKILVDDDNTGIFHVFEQQIGMNEFAVFSLHRGPRLSNACETMLFPDQVH